MQVNGTPNKFEIFQDFYYEQNGVLISYAEALRLFSQMDADTAADFEQYYEDETGYEIIVPNGYNLDQDLGSPKATGTKIVRKKEKQSDGSIKWVDKEVKTWTFGKTETDENGNEVFVEHVSATTQNAINTKYSIDAYAKKNGLVLDPQWAIYSAEEIMQMVSEGVNVPQDVVDIANTILQSTASEETAIEGEDGQEDTTLTFVQLIPEAEKKIDKCEENTEKIEKEIENLIPEQQKQQKKADEKIESQLEQLSTYEENVREWTRLDDKVKNGEQLDENETKRYEELSKLIQDDKSKDEGNSFNKVKLSASLNALNILSAIGIKLAGEAVEVGETLADYTSKANYKTTFKQASGEVGFFRAIIAMFHGKSISKEAVKTGNATKEFSETAQESVGDISEVLNIELNEIQYDENGEIIEPEGNNSTEESEENQEKEEEYSIKITDSAVLEMIEEAKVINDETLGHVQETKSYLKEAKKDIKFSEKAEERINEIIKTFEEEEAIRQKEIEEKENENEASQEKIEEIKEEARKKAAEDQNQEMKSGYAPTKTTNNGKNSDDDENIKLDPEAQKEIKQHEENIEKNEEDIEGIKAESEIAAEAVKQNVSKEKTYINKAIPEEVQAFETVSEYSEEEIPEVKEQLQFTMYSGIVLSGLGSSLISLGAYYIEFAAPLLSNPFTAGIGTYFMALGTACLTKGGISAGIGLSAIDISETGLNLEEGADEFNESALEKIPTAIEDLGTLDEKIIGITGEESAMAGVMQDEEAGEEGEENAEGTENGETSVDGETTAPAAEGTEEGAEPAAVAEAAATAATASKPAEAEGVEGVEEPAAQEPAQETPAAPTEETPKDPAAEEAAEENAEEKTENAQNVPGGEKEEKEEDPEAMASNAKKQEKQLEKQTDKQEDVVKAGAKTAKDAGKESKKIEKDEKKDAKKLEQEAKQLEQQIKKEQEEAIALAEESRRAVQRQQEIMVEYEALTAENEKMMAEEEAKQLSKPKQQPAAQPKDGEQGGLLAPKTLTITSTSDGSDNRSKLAQNEMRINELGIEFKSQDSIVIRNRVKMTTIQESIKTKSVKFEKKLKLKDKKIKETEKKEKEKQKKLNKIFGAIGIAENIFSITSTTGLVMFQVGTSMIATGTAQIVAGKAQIAAGTPLLSSLVTLSAGIALVTSGTIQVATGTLLEINGSILTYVGDTLAVVGLVGTATCGVTKGVINIANGNLAAGLMAIGATAVSVVTSVTGCGAAAGSALNYISEGLSIVSSSAELVNNVRAVQGKEANGVMSKIGTIAGAGSAVAGAADSVSKIGEKIKFLYGGEINKLNDLGKMLTIVSATGTALSSTSKLMSEFGGDEKTANMLGMIGGGLQTIGSIAQLANENNKTENGNENNNNEKEETNIDKEVNKSIENNKNLTPEQKAEARAAVEKFKNDPKFRAQVEGTRDSIIDQTLNTMNLNDKQKAAVKQNLQKAGNYNEQKPAQQTAQSENKLEQSKQQANTTAASKPASDGQGNTPASKASDKLASASELKSADMSEAQVAEAANALRSENPAEASALETQASQESAEPAETKQTESSKKFEAKNMEENGASEEYADLDDATLEDYRQEAIGQGDEELAQKYKEEQTKRAEFKKNKKQEKTNNIIDLTGQVANTTAQVLGMAMSNNEGEVKKKVAAPGKLTKRAKEIMRKDAKYRRKRVQALARAQRYYA